MYYIEYIAFKIPVSPEFEPINFKKIVATASNENWEQLFKQCKYCFNDIGD